MSQLLKNNNRDVPAHLQVPRTSPLQHRATPCITQYNFTTYSLGDEVYSFSMYSDLSNSTEKLREQLIHLYCKEGAFSSEKVVKKSQELDKYIVKIQKMGKDKKYSI
nr:aspartyl-phosphate phosphatase Spo0E family protein [Brevibacillus laterosporus]